MSSRLKYRILVLLLASGMCLSIGAAFSPARASQVRVHKARMIQHWRMNRNRKQSIRTKSRPLRNVLKPTSLKRYHVVHNHDDDLFNKSWMSKGSHRRETVRSISGPKVTFKTVRFLPRRIGSAHYLQSIAVTPNGHYAYLGYGASSYLSGYTKIARVNLRRRHGGIKAGRRFFGGHGQALSYNPRTNQLWLLVDVIGPVNRGAFAEISAKSLRPVHRLRFRFGNEEMGDDLAFDSRGTAYNEDRIWNYNSTGRFHPGSIVLYRGLINRHRAKFVRINQGIFQAPGQVIQGMACNPRTRRLYIETDEAIMSMPIRKLGHLSSRNVKETILKGHREYEGLSFDRTGHAYILMNQPDEVLRSTRVY